MSEIRFYRAKGEYGYLSNLYPCEFIFEGRVYSTAEHAYQFGKPNKPEIAEWLLQAPSPSLCAQAAHSLFMWQVRSDWNDIKVERMRQVLCAKFTQNTALAMRLKETGDAQLIEESTMDAFWGIGKKGNGKNMLGHLLTELRSQLVSA